MISIERATLGPGPIFSACIRDLEIKSSRSPRIASEASFRRSDDREDEDGDDDASLCVGQWPFGMVDIQVIDDGELSEVLRRWKAVAE